MSTKRWIRGILCLAMSAGISNEAFAENTDKDLSWFGQSGATSAPVRDVDGVGHWWWPTQSVSNENDQELWGNRGVVYGVYPPKHTEVVCILPPPPLPPPTPIILIDRFPIANSVLFDFDSAVLKPEGQKEVAQVSDILKKYPEDMVVIEGHTCDVGEEDYNLKLSQRRAESIQDALIRNGIDTKRITAIGYGETRPAVKNSSREERAKNRRVVFVFKI